MSSTFLLLLGCCGPAAVQAVYGESLQEQTLSKIHLGCHGSFLEEARHSVGALEESKLNRSHAVAASTVLLNAAQASHAVATVPLAAKPVLAEVKAVATRQAGPATAANISAALAKFTYPSNDIKAPTAGLISVFSNLLEKQASTQTHRSILSAMHANLAALKDVPEEQKELIQIQEERKNKFGASSMNVAADGKSYFSMGEGTPMVPYAMHKSHRERFMDAFTPPESTDWVLFEGAQPSEFYDTDCQELAFRQDATFMWLFGVQQPFFLGAINVRTRETHLFIPKATVEKKVWFYRDRDVDWYKNKFEVDHVHNVDDILSVLKEAVGSKGKPAVAYDDSHIRTGTDGKGHPLQAHWDKLTMTASPDINIIIGKLRSIKDAWEIQIMQYVNDVSSEAHVASMYQSATGSLRGGPASMEYAAEGVFRYMSFMRGCIKVLYQASCPAGTDIGIIHFGESDYEPQTKHVDPDQLRLQDMAAAYAGYTADVALTYPAGGKFSDEQRKIYDIVLEATMTAEAAAGPGSSFGELTAIADKVLLAGLLETGILRGSLDELVSSNIVREFMPHMIGHHLGLDVHDPGADSSFEPGMIITIEPAIYFSIKTERLQKEGSSLAQYVDRETLQKYSLAVGGARVEDALLITEKGNRVMTRLPRRASDIEWILSGGGWDPRKERIFEYPASKDFNIREYILSTDAHAPSSTGNRSFMRRAWDWSHNAWTSFLDAAKTVLQSLNLIKKC